MTPRNQMYLFTVYPDFFARRLDEKSPMSKGLLVGDHMFTILKHLCGHISNATIYGDPSKFRFSALGGNTTDRLDILWDYEGKISERFKTYIDSGIDFARALSNGTCIKCNKAFVGPLDQHACDYCRLRHQFVNQDQFPEDEQLEDLPQVYHLQDSPNLREENMFFDWEPNNITANPEEWLYTTTRDGDLYSVQVLWEFQGPKGWLFTYSLYKRPDTITFTPSVSWFQPVRRVYARYVPVAGSVYLENHEILDYGLRHLETSLMSPMELLSRNLV
jgi:hypothetical protein